MTQLGRSSTAELGWDRCERELSDLRRAYEGLRAVLERIAAGRRPDGTYNLSREACEQMAKEALSE